MTKRRCEAVTARDEPCKARPLRDSDFCLLHSPDSSPAELGRKGGRGRGKKTDELELSDKDAALAALRRALDGGNMAAMVAASKVLLDMPSGDPRTSWAHVYRVDELLTRVARLKLMVASLKLELKLQGAEVDDVELDDHVDDLIKIFLETMTQIADKAEHSSYGGHVFEAARREIARALDDEERVGTARPVQQLRR